MSVVYSALSNLQYCRQWYSTPTGLNTLRVLQQQLNHAAHTVFGYYALEMGALAGQFTLLDESRIQNHFCLSDVISDNATGIIDSACLPIQNHSVDLVIASHCLDYALQPKQVLRELDRVLLPDGHCFIVGFNPVSLRGVQQRLRKSGKTPCRFMTPLRVADWLSVLGFEVLDTCAVHPENVVLSKSTSWVHTTQQAMRLLTSPVYMIHAQKRVVNLTPMTPPWRKLPTLAPPLIANPNRTSQRQTSND